LMKLRQCGVLSQTCCMSQKSSGREHEVFSAQCWLGLDRRHAHHVACCGGCCCAHSVIQR
jgi:hypothetical protein